MTTTISTKKALHSQLLQDLNQRIDRLEYSIRETSDSMKNDTKSSAGDKFETGREMMQIELNNQHAQLNQLLRLKKDLTLIDPNVKTRTIEFGSLVETSNGHYFIAVALGKVKVDKTTYYARLYTQLCP